MTTNTPLTPDYTGIPSGGFIASPQPSPMPQQHHQQQPQYPPQFQQYPPQRQQQQQYNNNPYAFNPYQQGQPPPNTQQLAPYTPGPPQPVQNHQLQQYMPASMQNPHAHFEENTDTLVVPPRRPRMGSEASMRSHRSSHSHHSSRSRHSSESHRSERSHSSHREVREMKELEKRPSWGDSVAVMYKALTGAFDKRKP